MTRVVTTYEGTPSLGTAIFVKIREPATNTILVARTNSGIVERDAGRYTYVTDLTDYDAYDAVWDENDGVFAGEIVIPRATVTVNVAGGVPLPVTGDANGDLAGKTFLIKRNDTLPYLRRQFVDSGGNAIPISASDTVMFTMRSSADVSMAGTAKVHGAATIIDAANGIVEYRWVAGDTDTTTWSETSLLGNITETKYAAEFELTRVSDGKIETFPQGGYIAVSIPPDLDPGVTP